MIHTQEERFNAAVATMIKEGWPPDMHEGQPLLLSEGELALACFEAGYAMAEKAAADRIEELELELLESRLAEERWNDENDSQ